eukprot:Gregarina_sp_Poly_1__7277@NODE_3_length_27868_cov_154_961188_g2_i0_p26_GENE_NODE_3_length_27868_cov_154_961188_g2_i0NODE_3_length_27868_cov_154_961188_g2_i0_p26_ORF_typecomplete_len117_score12_84Pneumo_ncap/PF03246_13/0_12_NODE_3_length_27868_cov_154_961188_g2_i01344313793
MGDAKFNRDSGSRSSNEYCLGRCWRSLGWKNHISQPLPEVADAESAANETDKKTAHDHRSTSISSHSFSTAKAAVLASMESAGDFGCLALGNPRMCSAGFGIMGSLRGQSQSAPRK